MYSLISSACAYARVCVTSARTANNVKFNKSKIMAKSKNYSNIPKLEKLQTNGMDETGTFMIINVEDKWRIGMAGAWCTKEIFETKEDAQKYINEKPWDLITNLAGAIAQFVVTEQLKSQNK